MTQFYLPEYPFLSMTGNSYQILMEVCFYCYFLLLWVLLCMSLDVQKVINNGKKEHTKHLKNGELPYSY